MKLPIKNNIIQAIHSDDQLIESKYPSCTFLLVPDGKYTAEHTDTVLDGEEVRTITSSGPIRCGDPAPVLDAEDTLANIRYQRSLEYPPLGDVIDALFKKEAGDATEWNAIAESRTATKNKYPKQ